MTRAESACQLHPPAGAGDEMITAPGVVATNAFAATSERNDLFGIPGTEITYGPVAPDVPPPPQPQFFGMSYPFTYAAAAATC